MNKQKFTQLVRDYHDISAEDRQKLHELVANFPYSQIIHTLVAKANMDAHTDIANQTLGYAAMYAADRGVLKEIIDPKSGKSKPAVAQAPQKKQPVITEKPAPRKAKPQATQVKAEPAQMPKGTKVTIDKGIMHPGMQPLRDQILADLQTLKESKATYMHWLNLPDEPSPLPKAEPKATAPPKKKKPATKATGTKKKTTAKSAKKTTEKATPRKKTTTKAATKAKVPAKKISKAATKKISKSKTNTASKTKTSSIKKKKQPDQAEIIDDFISKEPSITSKASRKSPNNQEDLSQHSTEFTEGLVSENLARIMITQGKTDKAIDIYKKLIWKFPQKKAYFASQIEELKN